MLKKIKKFMVVAAAAVMLSAGFATVAPKEASAHWADNQMNWAKKTGIITADLRDSLATRQDMWLMSMRFVYKTSGDFTYEDARSYAIRYGISDGTRGTNWITRSEAAAMVYQIRYDSVWNPTDGFYYSDRRAKAKGIFDGTRGNDFATRAEVVTMLYNL
ncbi:protein phosphatase 2C [Bacillus toyonensis]|uniref:protein phosphatase 2C n=1 Tax=Bacillus toyonensis TaxID=155322 RepID=UPI0026F764A2|nr:protein phosphatase 2C [Bacillus toyonensis]MDO8161671.1 protein phosphatase 2C [Bacillus toyonensis]